MRILKNPMALRLGAISLGKVWHRFLDETCTLPNNSHGWIPMSSQSGLKKGNLIVTQFLSHCQKTGDSEKREVWYLFPWFLLCWVVRGGWHPYLTAFLTQSHFLQVTARFLKLLNHAFKDVHLICFQYSSVENSAEMNNFFPPWLGIKRLLGLGH